MPIQNRVDPFGQLHVNASRGLFMGNRGGRFHDPEAKTLDLRHWASKSWIICVCEFKNRQRNVWGIQKNGKPAYTELFFLDEVTALAAGHRPCFECRRQAAKAYATAFEATTGIAKPKVRDMDGALHAQRCAAGAELLPITRTEIAALPDGAMLAADGQPFAIKAGAALPWAFDGYGAAVPIAGLSSGATLLTPPTSISVLRNGYQPVWHPSALGAQASVD